MWDGSGSSSSCKGEEEVPRVGRAEICATVGKDVAIVAGLVQVGRCQSNACGAMVFIIFSLKFDWDINTD